MVLRWLAAQDPSAVYTTTITHAELLYGIELLQPGKRRTRLREAVERIVAEEFAERILPFDEQAVRELARIVAARDAAGRPISQFDAMIAAISKSHRAALATRNAADFQECGILVVNPWLE